MPTSRRRRCGPRCEPRRFVSVAVGSESAARDGSPAGAAARWAPALAAVLCLALLLAAGEVVLDGAVGHSPLIPKSPAIASWLSGIGERLGFRTFLVALLVSVGAYLGLLVLSSRLGAVSKRKAIGAICVLHGIVFLGPILISTDVFSYIAYARMGVVHSINPYTHGPISIVGDPVFHYVGHDWLKVATAYGPLYTLISYPLGLLGGPGALWGMKVLALAARAGTLLLVWRCARARGFDPVFALLAVGANPLYILYGLGGAHNDLLMMAAMMAAVGLTLLGQPGSRREG